MIVVSVVSGYDPVFCYARVPRKESGCRERGGDDNAVGCVDYNAVLRVITLSSGRIAVRSQCLSLGWKSGSHSIKWVAKARAYIARRKALLEHSTRCGCGKREGGVDGTFQRLPERERASGCHRHRARAGLARFHLRCPNGSDLATWLEENRRMERRREKSRKP